MKIIGQLKAILGLDKTQYDRELDEAERKTNRFSVGMKKLGTAMAAAFAAVVSAIGLVITAMKSTEATSDKLNFAVASLKGGFQGLMRTIVTGDWASLIDNMVRGAKAAKDYKIAIDELADIEASNAVKRGYLERQLQAARVAAAEVTDPKLKAQYIEEAINAQKAITTVNVSEIQKRIDAYEGYFQTVLGFDDETMKILSANLRKIAHDESLFLKEGGLLEQWKLRLEQLNTERRLLSDAEKIEKRRLASAIESVEVYKELRNNLKPGEFNEYIKTIGELESAVADGDQAIVWLTRLLTNQETKINKAKEAINEYKTALDRLNIIYKGMYKEPVGEYARPATPFNYGEVFKRLGHAEILGTAKQTEDMTKALQIQNEAVGILANSFNALFSANENGWDAMIDSMISSFKRLVAEIAAKAAILGLISLIFPGTAFGASALTGLRTMFTIPGAASGGTVPPGYPHDTFPAMLSSGETILTARQSRELNRMINVHVTGEIAGNVINLAQRRSQYES